MAAQAPGGRHAASDAQNWAATRSMTVLQTQMMGDEEDYLATQSKAIGRRIDDVRHELFVVCDPAEALAQQFEHHTPEFIALHDLGLDGAGRLLAAVARAIHGKVQQLVVRRQGFGVPLATLSFIELPAAAGAPQVRIYSTQVDASDESQRIELAKVLLGHSRLGVFLVGTGSATQNVARLQPLSDAMYEPGWRNRQLLWLPVGADACTAPPSSLGSRRGVVQLHAMPPSADLAQAWPVISALWDQLRAGTPVALPSTPAPSAAAQAATAPRQPPAPYAPGPVPHAPAPVPHAPAPVPHAAAPVPYTPAPVPMPVPVAARPAPLPLRPMPATQATTLDDTVAGSDIWRHYVRECAAIPGMVSCCVFELASQRSLAHAGTRPGAASLAAHGAALYQASLATGRALGLTHGEFDLALTLGEHHLVLHAFAQHPGLLFHAVLDAHVANLTLVRMKLHRLDPGELASTAR